MQKLDQHKVNNIISHHPVNKEQLKGIVNFYQNEQDKKYMSIKANDYESEANKELALIDSRCWSFLQEIFKGDDIQTSQLHQGNKISQMQKSQIGRSDMEIEQQAVQKDSSVLQEQLEKINQNCPDSFEKQQFYYEFYLTWYSKNYKQRMQYQSYDTKKMLNFLFAEENSNKDTVSIEKSKGMIAPKSYSDLEIILDLIYYDNHLQRFAKLIKWVQNYCLTSEAVDPKATRSRKNSNEKPQIENWSTTQNENTRLLVVYTLLKQGQGESAARFMQEQNMILPLSLIDTVFPYHDFLLSDSNNPLSLQPYLIQNELKSNFLTDIFDNEQFSQTLKERIGFYKLNNFGPDNMFNKSIGNQNWLSSLNSAFLESQDKQSSGEILYFSYLSSNKHQMLRCSNSSNDQWYESVWITLKHLYIHEIIKRFLVIKGLLFDSIEQYYPNYDNAFIDFSESPLNNYRKLFQGSVVEDDIFQELETYLKSIRSDKCEIQTHLILAYLKRETDDDSRWQEIFKLLQQSSKQAYESRDKHPNQSTVCEFNAKLAFSLIKSSYFSVNHTIQDYYDDIIVYFVLFLIPQDRSSEIIVFLKTISDENRLFGLMAKYLAQKQTEMERKKIKEDMLLYGYTDQQIQGILKELVTSQFSNVNGFEGTESVSDQSIIDGLKMFIESYQSNNIYTCMDHFLSAAKKFISDEKLQVYQQMRGEREISQMIDHYLTKTNSKGNQILSRRDTDPFLNQLSAYDELVNCYKLIDELQNINQIQQNMRNSDVLRQPGRNTNQMVSENEARDPQQIRASEFISKCESTFFKVNMKSRNPYILIDGNIEFSEPGLKQYNQNAIVLSSFSEISRSYLFKIMLKCIEVAQNYKIGDQILNVLTKYYSPTYNAFSLLSFDEQELLLKKSTTALTSNTRFMRTVLNL